MGAKLEVRLLLVPVLHLLKFLLQCTTLITNYLRLRKIVYKLYVCVCERERERESSCVCVFG